MPTTPHNDGAARQYRSGRPRQRRRKPRSWLIFLLLALAMVLLAFVVEAAGLLAGRGREPAGSGASSSPPSTSLGEVEPAGGEPDEGLEESVPPDTAAPARPAADPEDWRLVLVNAENRLEEDYPVTLAPVQGDYQLDERIVADLQAMIAAAAADGYTLQVYSAYRPMERSRVLYENKVNEYIAGGYSTEAAKAEAAKWIAPPGTSEHNTGLAADIISGDYFTKFSDLVHEFETCPEFTWMYEHCADYGFILRYPREKQEVTGITYEPWHYRYVGRENAKAIMEQKLCLEEYLGRNE